MKKQSEIRRGKILVILAMLLLQIAGVLPSAYVQVAADNFLPMEKYRAELTGSEKRIREIGEGKIRLDVSKMPERKARGSEKVLNLDPSKFSSLTGHRGAGAAFQGHENAMPAWVIEGEKFWNGFNAVIDQDIYVAPGAVLVIQGDATLEGNLHNYGLVILQGDLEAEYVYSNRYLEEMSSTYSDGDFIKDPDYFSASFAREHLFLEDIQSLPGVLFSSKLVNHRGYLPFVQGAVLPFVELETDSGPVILDNFGSFSLQDYFIGSEASLNFTITDPIGKAFLWKVDLEHAGYMEPSLQVLAGFNRFRTAQAVSSAMYEAADTAILVNALDFPDALAAGPLAYAAGAPILLTGTDTLNDVTRQEFKRLGVRHVIIMGGSAVISEQVEEELKASYTTERVAGSNRYSTAVAAAQRLKDFKGSPDTIVMTSGVDFPDALSAGSYASSNGYPLLLSNGRELHQRDLAFIEENSVKRMVLVGGSSVIPDTLEADLKNRGLTVERISGQNRERTSVAMASEYFKSASKTVVASGYNFVDAVTAIPFAASLEAPILLVREDRVSPSITEFLENSYIHSITFIGGDAVINQDVRNILFESMQ